MIITANSVAITVEPSYGYKTELSLNMTAIRDIRGITSWVDMGSAFDNYKCSVPLTFDAVNAKKLEVAFKEDATYALTDLGGFYPFTQAFDYSGTTKVLLKRHSEIREKNGLNKYYSTSFEMLPFARSSNTVSGEPGFKSIGFPDFEPFDFSLQAITFDVLTNSIAAYSQDPAPNGAAGVKSLDLIEYGGGFDANFVFQYTTTPAGGFPAGIFKIVKSDGGVLPVEYKVVSISVFGFAGDKNVLISIGTVIVANHIALSSVNSKFTVEISHSESGGNQSTIYSIVSASESINLSGTVVDAITTTQHFMTPVFQLVSASGTDAASAAVTGLDLKIQPLQLTPNITPFADCYSAPDQWTLDTGLDLPAPESGFETTINSDRGAIELNGSYYDARLSRSTVGEVADVEIFLDDEKARLLIQFLYTNRGAQMDSVFSSGYYPFGRLNDSYTSGKTILYDNDITCVHIAHRRYKVTFSIQLVSVS